MVAALQSGKIRNQQKWIGLFLDHETVGSRIPLSLESKRHLPCCHGFPHKTRRSKNLLGNPISQHFSSVRTNQTLQILDLIIGHRNARHLDTASTGLAQPAEPQAFAQSENNNNLNEFIAFSLFNCFQPIAFVVLCFMVLTYLNASWFVSCCNVWCLDVYYPLQLSDIISSPSLVLAYVWIDYTCAWQFFCLHITHVGAHQLHRLSRKRKNNCYHHSGSTQLQ